MRHARLLGGGPELVGEGVRAGQRIEVPRTTSIVAGTAPQGQACRAQTQRVYTADVRQARWSFSASTCRFWPTLPAGSLHESQPSARAGARTSHAVTSAKPTRPVELPDQAVAAGRQDATALAGGPGRRCRRSALRPRASGDTAVRISSHEERMLAVELICHRGLAWTRRRPIFDGPSLAFRCTLSSVGGSRWTTTSRRTCMMASAVGARPRRLRRSPVRRSADPHLDAREHEGAA